MYVHMCNNLEAKCKPVHVRVNHFIRNYRPSQQEIEFGLNSVLKNRPVFSTNN